MNLSPYLPVVALSGALEALLSLASILNLIQFSVQPSLQVIPCLTAYFFLILFFHKSR